jgi:hypothetical protein
LRQLTSHRRDDYPLAFTADGAGLVLLSDRRGHGMDIYRQELGARDAVLVGKGGCVHALAPGGGEVLVGREVEGALRFVGYDLTPGAVERRLPLTARDCQAKLRCGRAGCVPVGEGRRSTGPLARGSRLDREHALRPSRRVAQRLAPRRRRRARADRGRRQAAAEHRHARRRHHRAGKAGLQPRLRLLGERRRSLPDLRAPRSLLHSLVHRTVDGGETTLWSSAEQYLGSVTLSPDGRTMAVALRSFDANVWMLEGL